MKITAAILGLAAGLLGMIGGFAQTAFGAIGKELGEKSGESIANAGAGAFWLSLLILIFGGLIFLKGKTPVMIFSIAVGALGLIVIFLGNIFSGPIAITGGVLGIIAATKIGKPQVF